VQCIHQNGILTDVLTDVLAHVLTDVLAHVLTEHEGVLRRC
jgi:hypothetical protein